MFLNTDTSICLIIPIAQILFYPGRVIFLLVLGGCGLSYLCLGDGREHWLFIFSLAFCYSHPLPPPTTQPPITPTPNHPSPPTTHRPSPPPQPPTVSYGYSLVIFPWSHFRFVWGFCSYLFLDCFSCSLGVSSSYLWILVDACLPGGILASFILPFFHGLCSLFVGCFSNESTLFSSLWACLIFFFHDVS